MAFFSGKDGVVKAGDPAAAEVQSWTFDLQASVEAAWSMGDAAVRHYVSAPPTGSGSLEVFLDPSDPAQSALMTPGASVALELYPGGEVSGTGYFTFSAIIESVSRSASKTDIPTASVSFKIDGAVTSQTVA